jgi:uracil-DNA glycosylase family 4
MPIYVGGQVQVDTAQDDVDLLRRLECKGCSLNEAKLHSPKMLPSGSKEPLVYIMGDSPSLVDDDADLQLTGRPEGLLKKHIPAEFRSKIRYNNSIRCYPGKDKKPDKNQMHCCSPSIERDIERCQPVAIIGFGESPLKWTGKDAIHMWRGRRFPVRAGNHVCWYYAMQHPLDIIDNRRFDWTQSDDEIAFGFDMKRAFAEIKAGLPKAVIHDETEARRNITNIFGGTKKDLDYVLDFLEYAEGCDVSGVDYETSHLRPYSKGAQILTKAVSIEEGTLAFAWLHREGRWTDDQLARLQKAWVRFLKSKCRKAVANLSFEIEWSAFFYGKDLADLEWLWEDTQTQAFCLDERVGDMKPGAIGLDFITMQHFGLSIKKLTRGLKKDAMADEPLSRILPYNGIDAKYHRLNYIAQDRRLAEENLLVVYEEKVRQVPTVVLTQMKGLPVDPEENAALRREYEPKLKKALQAVLDCEAAREFKRLTGGEFNPLSTPNVITVLRDILKTREGQAGKGWSTTEDVLSKISDPIGKLIIAFRKVNKQKGTYIDPMSPGSSCLYEGNILHPNFGTTFTATGRLQSDDPNVQNFPIRTEEGRKARRQIKKPVVASFDYGQIDARIIACGSRDENYCRALWENYDIHLEWAKRLAKYHPAWVGGKEFITDPDALKKFRSGKVKNQWVFALFYGAALKTTAHRFDVEPEFLEKPYKEFWEQFADVKVWQEKLMEQFKQLGYVQLFEGLRRHAPLSKGELINTPVQGGTNRIVMDAMNRLSEQGVRTGNFTLLQANLQIHDDLTFCFESEREYEDCAPIIIDAMVDGRAFPWFCVPLVIEHKRGNSWADMGKEETFSSVDRLKWPIRAKEFM